MQHTQPARKILVVGGSSYNENTLQKIGQALIDSNFLGEWAVIIAIHQLLRLDHGKHTVDEIKNYVEEALALPNIFFITKPGQTIVETGNIYVLPDPVPCHPPLAYLERISFLEEEYAFRVRPIDIDKYVATSFLDDNDQLKIHAEGSTAYEKSQQWFLNDPYDADGKKRVMTAHDRLYGDPKSLPIGDESNQSPIDEVFKLKLEKESPDTLLYQDMPCIDKFMSEVATSTNRAIIAGLLLCGLYGDGAKGLKKIKDKGGHTAVQYPDECCKGRLGKATASMPNTALKIEKHDIVTLEGTLGETTLSQWLSKIKES